MKARGTQVEVRYLTVAEVLYIHKQVIDEFGGSHGVRDMNLVESPVQPPKFFPDLKLASKVFFILVLLDAVMGGSIAALLRVEGWTALDQRINDVYQANYGLIVIATLSWLYFFKKIKKPVWAMAALFAGYVEDTLFYITVAIVNPFIDLLTKGETYHAAGGGLLPERISGWVGWVGRMTFGHNVSFDLHVVFALNAFAIASAYVILKRTEK
jgi:hypothetical protein